MLQYHSLSLETAVSDKESAQTEIENKVKAAKRTKISCEPAVTSKRIHTSAYFLLLFFHHLYLQPIPSSVHSSTPAFQGTNRRLAISRKQISALREDAKASSIAPVIILQAEWTLSEAGTAQEMLTAGWE